MNIHPLHLALPLFIFTEQLHVEYLSSACNLPFNSENERRYCFLL